MRLIQINITVLENVSYCCYCHKYRPLDLFTVKKNGLVYKTCNNCKSRLKIIRANKVKPNKLIVNFEL